MVCLRLCRKINPLRKLDENGDCYHQTTISRPGFFIRQTFEPVLQIVKTPIHFLHKLLFLELLRCQNSDLNLICQFEIDCPIASGLFESESVFSTFLFATNNFLSLFSQTRNFSGFPQGLMANCYASFQISLIFKGRKTDSKGS